MTLNQARILAIIVSLAYVPAHHFGIAIVWALLMVASIAQLANCQLNYALGSLGQISDPKRRSIRTSRALYRIIFADAFISAVGFLVVTAIHNTSMNDFYSVDAIIFAYIFKLFDLGLSYSALPLHETVALNALAFSALLFATLIAFCRRNLHRLLDYIHFIRAFDEPDKEKKFSIYMAYKTRFSLELPTLVLLHILYCVGLRYFLASHSPNIDFLVIPAAILPPLLYMETSVFFVRMAVYFKNF